MWQELFSIPVPHFLQTLLHLGPSVAIYGYGLMLVIGFFAGMELAKFLARRAGLNPEIFVNAALLALFSGIVGARTSHVIENLADYMRIPDLGDRLWAMVNVRSGGLTYYGGVLLATPTLILYGLWKRVPVRIGMDIIAPCLMIGLGFGRIGCYLNGCCYGAPCNLPWAVQFPYHSDAYIEQWDNNRLKPPPELLQQDRSGRVQLLPADQARVLARLRGITLPRALPVHPAQLYSSFTAFLLALLLLAWYTLPHAPGRVFALMCLLEGTARYLLEMLRAEPNIWGTHMSLGMVTGAFVATAGLVLWFVFRGPIVLDNRPPSA